MTTPRKPKRTAAESAQYHKQEAERHARKAWLAENPHVKKALDVADQCLKLSGEFETRADASTIGTRLYEAWHSIDEACEHVIQAGLATPAPAAQGKENE